MSLVCYAVSGDEHSVERRVVRHSGVLLFVVRGPVDQTLRGIQLNCTQALEEYPRVPFRLRRDLVFDSPELFYDFILHGTLLPSVPPVYRSRDKRIHGLHRLSGSAVWPQRCQCDGNSK